ncbi:MAG: DUF721 domain-containing protein [Pseudomonadota bacterium]
MEHRRSQLTHISNIINNKMGKSPLFIIFRNWKEIVGPTIFKIASPVKIKDQTLLVAVKTHTWLQELNLSKHIMLKKITPFVPEIEDVQFILSGRTSLRKR